MFLMALNHSITDAVFLHWLNLDALVILLLILSRIVLLILPISDLVGLTSRQVGLKFGLWSLSVMNDTVPLAYMLTAKTNYIRSDTRKSGAHIRLFCAHDRKKCATHVPLKYIKAHTATRWTIRHSLMLLWFADLMNVTEEVTIHRPKVSTLLSSSCLGVI